jgi:hypothetical protein
MSDQKSQLPTGTVQEGALPVQAFSSPVIAVKEADLPEPRRGRPSPRAGQGLGGIAPAPAPEGPAASPPPIPGSKG